MKSIDEISTEDIIDPMIENGLDPRISIDDMDSFIDFETRLCSGLGALVLSLGLEKVFTSRDTPGLFPKLEEAYNTTKDVLQGIEAGFDEDSALFSLPIYRTNKQFRKGYIIGLKALRAMRRPPEEE